MVGEQRGREINLMFAPQFDASTPESLPKARLEHPYKDWTIPTLPANLTWAVCETEAEVDHLAHMTDLKIDAIIAVTPQAASQCYQMNRPYLKLEDFYDVTAFCDADEPMLQLQGRWADQVDEFVWQALPEFQCYGLRPVGHYFFWLKVVSDMLYRAAFGLSHWLLASRPVHVIYFEPRLNPVISETLFFSNTLYAQILPILAPAYGVTLKRIPAQPRSETIFAPKLRMSDWLKQSLPPKMVSALRFVRDGGMSPFLAACLGKTEQVDILYQRSPETDLVMAHAQKQGYKVGSLSRFWLSSHRASKELRQKLDDLWPRMISQPYFGDPFRWCGVNLFPVAESRLRVWWFTVIPAMWHSLSAARSSFRNHRPRVVFFSSPTKPEEYGVLQAAHSLGIPTVTYQHGGFEGNCEYTTHDMTDLRHADYRLVYGEGPGNYVRERRARYAEPRAQSIIVGSTRLDAFRTVQHDRAAVRRQLRIAPSEKLVLLLPTSYQYNWYVARQAYLGVPYFELLVDVVRILGEFTDIQFVYKSFPETPPDPLVRVISAQCQNCRIVTDIPVPALIEASDANVLDIPSTGLLEALLWPRPLLVFSDARFITLRPKARVMLRKRVTLCETANEYLVQLRQFLSQGRFSEIENPNQEFLATYGTYLNDGNSAPRAVESLRKIMLGTIQDD